MFASEEINPRSATVREFALSPELGLDIEVILGGAGMAREIRSLRIQKPGLALAGYTAYVHPDRIQLFGGSKVSYLQALEPREHRQSLCRPRVHLSKRLQDREQAETAWARRDTPS